MTRARPFVVLAFSYLLVAVVVLSVLVFVEPEVPQRGDLWVVLSLFGLAAGFISYRSAEINDRLFASSALMVTFSAGVFLALRSAENASAAVPMALIGAVSFLSAGDVKGRKIVLPAANFGQLVISFAAGGLVIDLVFGTFGTGWLSTAGWLSDTALASTFRDTFETALVPSVIAGLAGAVVSALTNLLLVRLGVRMLYRSSKVLPWSGILGIVASQTTQGLVGALLGFVLASSPSLLMIPAVLSVFIIGHITFTSQATLRSAHEAMLRGFVKILETRDLYTRGHTERVAEFALAVGRELDFSETQLARLRWAALIHDVGKLAVPTAIMRKQGSLTPEEYRQMRIATHKVDDLLSEVEFLAPMVIICSGVHPNMESVEDFGQVGHTHSLVPTVEQSVLAVADAFDAMTSTRSHRMAMSQRMALARIDSLRDPLFLPEVVVALHTALGKLPGTYGPPELGAGLREGASRG